MKANLSRRQLLQAGAGFIGAGSVTAWLGNGAFARAVSPSDFKATKLQGQSLAVTPASATITPDQALERLMEGNQRFVQQKQIHPDQNMARIQEVAGGQAPFAAILSCADSRVSPEIIFDQGLGDLFVVRVAGNIATIEDIGSEEYAVAILGAPLIMVLGHESCGAVTAAVEREELPGVIESLVLAIDPAVKIAKRQSGDLLTNAIKANVKLQKDRLQYSSVITSAIEAGKLKIVGAYYDLHTGAISLVA
jgi:carbonic anhydrase